MNETKEKINENAREKGRTKERSKGVKKLRK